MKSVAVAMSGGVDSAVAALLLKEQGYRVEGITFELGGADPRAVSDAAQVCAALSIPHRVLDYRARFNERVVEPFIAEYLAGRTPNPCIFCNRTIKYGRFLEDAMADGFDFIATGHYARVTRQNGRWVLLCATDRKKDQSYVLYSLGQSQLARLLLPIGETALDKPALRRLAVEAALPVANRPDSQDICFIPDGEYAAFIERHCGATRPGRFVSEEGVVLGSHRGAFHYTLGQRKGLGVSLGVPAYVLEIASNGDVILTTDEQRLYASVLLVEDCTFCDGVPPDAAFDAQVRIRYSHREAPARVTMLSDRRAQIAFATPQRAPTPGQAAVFYQGERVLGGATIGRVEKGVASC